MPIKYDRMSCSYLFFFLIVKMLTNLICLSCAQNAPSNIAGLCLLKFKKI